MEGLLTRAEVFPPRRSHPSDPDRPSEVNVQAPRRSPLRLGLSGLDPSKVTTIRGDTFRCSYGNILPHVDNTGNVRTCIDKKTALW